MVRLISCFGSVKFVRRLVIRLQQADWHPVPLDNELGSRSISDDDLCAWCSHLYYRPGERSLCPLIEEDGDWPARFDTNGYAQSCTELYLIIPTTPQNG